MKKIKLILCVLGLSIGIAGCSEQKIEEPVLRPDESQVEQATTAVLDELVSEVESDELLIESKEEETKQKLVEEVDNTTEALEFLPDNDRVDAGEHYVAMVTPEGKVKVAYRDGWTDEEVLSTEWEAVVRLANTDSFPVGITKEGNLFVPQGRTLKDYESDMVEFEKSEANGGMYLGMKIANAKAMSEWNGLQQIYGEYSGCGALGLFTDGTVKEAGLIGIGMEARSLEELQTLKGIKALDLIYNGQYVVALLDNGEVKHISDGKVETLWVDSILWDNMVAVEAGKVMFYGLTKDGKVLHTRGPAGKVNTTKAMEDIVFIAVGYDESINSDVVYGIDKDGRVVDHEGKVVPGLEGVVEIAVMDFTPNVVIGMKADGTICVSDSADETMKQTISKWNKK